MTIWTRKGVCRGMLSLQGPEDTVIASPEIYQKISGGFAESECDHFITIDGNKLQYVGGAELDFHFTGSSECSVNKASKITFALFRNGILYPRAETPHDFPASAKRSTLSITAIVRLRHGDVMDVYCKSDSSGVTLTVDTLNIVFWGER